MALKILLSSNSPWATSGYGQAAYYLTKIWRNLGHEVAIFAYFGLEGGAMNYDGMKIYPKAFDPYGNDIVEAHAAHFGADLVISNVDVWVLSNWGNRTFHWYPLAPISEDPLTRRNYGALQGATGICALSQYGQRVLESAGFKATQIYLPVPTQFFCPLDKRTIKRSLGWNEDAYVIGHIGMNRGYRKGIDILLSAFQIFLAEHPNALLYIHTDTQSHDGLGLDELIDTLGIREKVVTPSRYDVFNGKAPQWMLGVYNSLDLYVQPSLGEGQAMPVWESFSCGVSVIATNGTALSEILAGDTDGVLVEPANKLWMPQGGFGYEITSTDLAAAMLKAYQDYGPNYVSVRNRQKAIEHVSLEVLSHKWQAELSRLEKIVRFQPSYRPFPQGKPSVVQVSTTDVNCGIGAYTRQLMAALEGATSQQCVEVQTLRTADQVPDCDLVHWHWEAAISPPESLFRDTLWSLRLRGIPILMTFHSIRSSLINDMFAKQLISAGVVHWLPPGIQADERLHVLGGMGCPMFNPPALVEREEMRARFGFGPFDTIISTFGFASVGRGHYEVLEQIAPFLQTHPQVKLQLILPANFLNEAGKNFVHQKIRTIAQQYKIEQQIHLIPEYLPDLEALQRLWISDVGYLYIEIHTASSSAALRFFISARCPLVANDSSHFADVPCGVQRVPTFNLTEFSQAVLAATRNRALLSKLKNEHEQTYEQFVWPKFAEKYLTYYKTAIGPKTVIRISENAGKRDYEVINRTTEAVV